MFPLRLNLLSPEKQRYLRRLVVFQFIKGILEITLFCICWVGIILIGAETILQNYFNDLVKNIVSIGNQYSQTNLEIRTLNSIIFETDKLQKEYVSWTPIISNITNATPESIVYSSWGLNAREKHVTLSGKVPNRDDLLKLQTNLQQMPWVKAATIPLSQLTVKENILFSINAYMK